VFDKLLADYVDQLALFEEETFGQTSEIEENTFTKLDGLGLANENAQVSGEIPKTDLDESSFVLLDEGSLAEWIT